MPETASRPYADPRDSMLADTQKRGRPKPPPGKPETGYGQLSNLNEPI